MGSAFGSALLPALARRRFLELNFSTSQGARRGAHSHHRKHENYVFNREEHWISLHLNRAILMLIILRASVMGSEGKCGKSRQSDEVERSTMLCSFSVSSLGLWYAANEHTVELDCRNIMPVSCLACVIPHTDPSQCVKTTMTVRLPMTGQNVV